MNKTEKHPLCKDCVHCKASWFERTFDRHSGWWECGKKFIPGAVSLVNGERKPDTYETCASMRIMECGREGKYWSPRNTKKFLLTVLKRI